MQRFTAGAQAINAGDLFTLIRKGVSASSTGAEAKKPFRFFLCGDPSLVAQFRALLLWYKDDANVPFDAPATLETIDPSRGPSLVGPDVRCAIFLGLLGDANPKTYALLEGLGIPAFSLIVDEGVAAPTGPQTAPERGAVGEYLVPRIDAPSLKARLFPHIIERCKGVEVAVGRRLPVLRDTVAAKLTRDAALSALKVAGASAVVDHVPVLGIVLGTVTSAGDMVAITGIQIVLMMQIGAAYGKDPDVQRMWELLPVVGGGLGWRAISRELSGFIPVAGIAIKSAVAYAGTIVVGEGVSFYYEHGRHMTREQAAQLYDDRKRAAVERVRGFIGRFKKPE